MPNEFLELLERPSYSFAEAERLAGAPRGASTRWLGAERRRGSFALHLKVGVASARAVSASGWPEEGASFLDLVELAAVARLKRSDFSLGDIQNTVAFCREWLGVPRPLISLELKRHGSQLFVANLQGGQQAPRSRFVWKQILEPFISTLDYSEEVRVAIRWWPLGREKPIVIDPAFGFGQPVVEGSGVRTEIILERFRAGDDRDQVAKDFGLEPIEVERALQFELQRAV